MFKHILEEKAEIAMYNKILMFLQVIFGRPKEKSGDRRLNKINKIAIQSIISLMLNNREYFMGLMNGKTDETLRQKPNGEFFMNMKEG